MAASAGELAARPRLRPLVRIPRRRDAPVRAVAVPRQPFGAPARVARGRLPPERRPRRPRDRFLGDLRAVDADRPFFCYFATGACHSPHHAPPRMDRALPRPVRRRLGRVARGDVRPPDRGAACSPRTRSSRRGRTGCRRGTRSRPRTSAVAARFMECFAAYLSYTDAQIGRLLDFLAEHRRPRQHADRRRLRQRRELRGRPEGLDQRRPPHERRARGSPRAARRASTRSAARPRTTTTRGAGRWRATRRSSAGSARCTRAASPIRASSRSPGMAPPGRGRASGTSSRTRSTCCRPCSSSSASTLPAEIDGVDAVARRRHELRVRCSRDAAAPGRHETQYFEMLGSPRHLPRRLEGGDVPPARRHVRRRPRPRRAVRRRRVGALPRRDGSVGEPTTSPRRSPNGSRRWSSCGGTRRAATTCSRSTTVRSFAILNPRPTTAPGRARRYVYYPNGAPVPEPVAVNVRNRSHTITADVEIPAGIVAEGTSARARLGARRLHAPPARRPPALRAQPLRRGARRRRQRRGDRRPARTESASCSRRRRSSPAAASCSSTGTSSATADIPHFTPMTFSVHRRRPDVRLRGRARRRRAATTRRSGATSTIERVVVDVSGDPERDPWPVLRSDHVGAIGMSEQ